MNSLLKEIEHELIALNGCFATDKDLAYFNEKDKENENYWRIDNNMLILRLENYIKNIKNDAYKSCHDILIEMNNLNDEMRNMKNMSEADNIYYENKMALLKMEYDLALLRCD